jgi:hypothetical protein
VAKELDCFYKQTRGKYERKTECKVCVASRSRNWYKQNLERKREHNRKWNEHNPEKMRSIKLKYQYGITQDKYEDMIKEQGGGM